jgi:hypothetical protein
MIGGDKQRQARGRQRQSKRQGKSIGDKQRQPRATQRNADLQSRIK